MLTFKLPELQQSNNTFYAELICFKKILVNILIKLFGFLFAYVTKSKSL